MSYMKRKSCSSELVKVSTPTLETCKDGVHKYEDVTVESSRYSGFIKAGKCSLSMFKPTLIWWEPKK